MIEIPEQYITQARILKSFDYDDRAPLKDPDHYPELEAITAYFDSKF